MFPSRKSLWGLVAIVVLLSVAARGDTIQQLAQEAQRRSTEYGRSAAQSPSAEQARAAAALAELARQRAQTERMAQDAAGAGASASPLGAASAARVPPAEPAEAAEPAAGASAEGRLIVALSSSMPLAMVHDYMRQLAGVSEAIVVLRGFLGGAHTVAPTGRWIEEARRVDPGCLRCAHYAVEVVVDPLVYRNLQIQQVPAVAYLPDVRDLSHCDGKALKVRSIAYGATSIEAAVKALVADGVEVPAGLLEKVRTKSWEQRVPKRSGS